MGTIKDLQSSFAEFRDVRDWKQFHTPKDLASAISIEGIIKDQTLAAIITPAAKPIILSRSL
jgi:hypothetical protein